MSWMADVSFMVPRRHHRVTVSREHPADMRPLHEVDITPLSTGAWILGSGGGGSPYDGWLNLNALYRDGVTIDLVDPGELDDDDLVAVVATMGAPLAGQERLADPELSAAPVRALEDWLGRRFQAVMAVEIGGGNGIEPFLVGAALNLPVVDADTMGRAFPEAQMTSFAIHDLTVFPMALGGRRARQHRHRGPCGELAVDGTAVACRHHGAGLDRADSRGATQRP